MRGIVFVLVREEISDVRRGVVVEAGNEGRDASVGLDLRGIEIELPPPDEARLLTEIDDLLEEPLEDVNPEPLPVGRDRRRGESDDPGEVGDPGGHNDPQHEEGHPHH